MEAPRCLPCHVSTDFRQAAAAAWRKEMATSASRMAKDATSAVQRAMALTLEKAKADARAKAAAKAAADAAVAVGKAADAKAAEAAEAVATAAKAKAKAAVKARNAAKVAAEVAVKVAEGAEAMAAKTAAVAEALRTGFAGPELHPPPVPPAGCPCSPELACEFTLNVTGDREALNCTQPRVWSPESAAWTFPPNYPTKCDYPHFHGGSGVLISIGAMRKVSYSDAIKCFHDDVDKLQTEPTSFKGRSHGDRLTSFCFWLHGIAMTDPGLSISPLAHPSVLGGRVMDSFAANEASMRAVIEGKQMDTSLWATLYMAATHVGDGPGSAKRAWELAELYPQARRAAVQQLERAGLLGRGGVDVLTAPHSPGDKVVWAKGTWMIKKGDVGKEVKGKMKEGDGSLIKTKIPRRVFLY
ncbi:hypothetical protein VOLCADRAFT_96593 [Volvox carteri f. nagariensis]|uniref:Uncharacterized protein n=1 Tax=Volvox carteri f. nagariensis TaxID=3068 RepID=D8UAI4_VOLCA|nr:uncharacterized protein VOLCADRAFT_96593 [Volvox carteri f. nagariensis]EFJ43264.1 hypothetical protein VOLCADRAFT_96593 [Volvox carteri f. nagariensis]|eukprot:XP_002955624.1 hypothetical protein VOLCADRAFT_96593 [Volvox carteri f. nagariensis]